MTERWGWHSTAQCDGEASSQKSEGAATTGTSEVEFHTPQPIVPTKSAGKASHECTTRLIGTRGGFASLSFTDPIPPMERGVWDEKPGRTPGSMAACGQRIADSLDEGSAQDQAPPLRREDIHRKAAPSKRAKRRRVEPTVCHQLPLARRLVPSQAHSTTVRPPRKEIRRRGLGLLDHGRTWRTFHSPTAG